VKLRRMMLWFVEQADCREQLSRDMHSQELIGGWFGNGVRHFNEVVLHRAWLVLGLVTTFGGSIPVFIQATQAQLVWTFLRG